MNPLEHPTDPELLAYLDETLSVERSAIIERLLREQSELRKRAAILSRQRDQGGHTIGEIWRRERLSCLSRQQLGSYLLATTPPDLKDYIEFHLQVMECRFCQANLEDLRQTQGAGQTGQQQRQRRYFESSAGLLRARRRE